jgi:hypothetical protein
LNSIALFLHWLTSVSAPTRLRQQGIATSSSSFGATVLMPDPGNARSLVLSVIYGARRATRCDEKKLRGNNNGQFPMILRHHQTSNSLSAAILWTIAVQTITFRLQLI